MGRRKVVQLFRSVYYIMRCFIVICLGLVLAVDGSARVRRDECEHLQADNDKCMNEAYEAYRVAMGKQDGREHFMARKSCNYMTAVLDTCMDKMKQTVTNQAAAVGNGSQAGMTFLQVTFLQVGMTSLLETLNQVGSTVRKQAVAVGFGLQAWMTFLLMTFLQVGMTSLLET